MCSPKLDIHFTFKYHVHCSHFLIWTGPWKKEEGKSSKNNYKENFKRTTKPVVTLGITCVNNHDPEEKDIQTSQKTSKLSGNLPTCCQAAVEHEQLQKKRIYACKISVSIGSPIQSILWFYTGRKKPTMKFPYERSCKILLRWDFMCSFLSFLIFCVSKSYILHSNSFNNLNYN